MWKVTCCLGLSATVDTGSVWQEMPPASPMPRCSAEPSIILADVKIVGLHDSHHRGGFSHGPSVALHRFPKLSRGFLVVWAAVLAHRFCPDRAAVIVQCSKPRCDAQRNDSRALPLNGRVIAARSGIGEPQPLSRWTAGPSRFQLPDQAPHRTGRVSASRCACGDAGRSVVLALVL